ncbi:hypothetical protein [Jonesia quinghaiensis]|uniref:hypothetical protein n=1 Tax=Jonesia quinghaiensis TaxID=262806 RepID=UPI000424A665|nr:hypothetical protein [Jonesia quinghaiensis]
MTTGQPPRDRSKNRLLLVAIVAIAVLTVAGIVYAFLQGRDNAPSAEETPPTASEPTTSQADGTTATCPPSESSTDTELTQAPDTTWVAYDNITYPSSPIYGPTSIAPDGFRYCFQQSPEGALFAAANMLTELHTDSDEDRWFNYVLSQEIFGRQGILDAISAEANDQVTDLPTLEILGFAMKDYTPERATVTVAAQATYDDISPTHSATFTLVWENNDWKWLVNNTSNALDITEISNTDGLIDWAP